MKILWRIHEKVTVLALCAIASGCGGGEPESDSPETGPEEIAVTETRAHTEGLKMWRADGFTMLVPDRSDIVPIDAEPPETWAAILAGPGFLQTGSDGVVQRGEPAYRLDVATYAGPDSVELEDWVAARLDERGGTPAATGVTVALAGEPAFRTGAAPGEEGATSYWLERDGKVVEFRLEEEPESPLAGIQRHVQSLILSTFRWSGEVAEP